MIRVHPWMLGCLVLLAAAASVEAQFLGDATRNHVRLVDPSHDDVLYPVVVNGRWGQMNQHGYLVVYPEFDWTDHSYDGLSRAMIGGRTGFIAGSGRWRIEPRYAYADRFADGLAVVGDGERYGYIRASGKVVVPIRLDGALRFREGMAAVQVGDRIGFIDVRGQMVIPPGYVRARSFHDGLAMVQLPGAGEADGPLGYIDKRGKLVFSDDSGRVTDLGDFVEGMARVRVGDQWGYLDRRMRFSVDPQFEDARDFAGGMAAVKVDGRWGYINKTGRLGIAATYHGADDFGHALAMVVDGEGRHGFIGRSGRVDIEPQFEWAEPFYRKYARVSRPHGFAYIGMAGNVIWDAEEARRGFVDVRLLEQRRRQIRRRDRFNQIVPAPASRPGGADPADPPYPPEHRYQEMLPR